MTFVRHLCHESEPEDFVLTTKLNNQDVNGKGDTARPRGDFEFYGFTVSLVVSAGN